MGDRLQLDALATQRRLRDRVVEFAESDAFLRDEKLAGTMRSLWRGREAEGGLVGELWVEGIFASKPSGLTLDDLGRSKVVSQALVSQLASAGAFPIDRVLYQHQEQAIRLEAQAVAATRPAIVVTAGTGAGKTEAFLLPLLNGLFRSPREAGQTGVRAIILYPMNALVNDQVARLDKWLRGQTRVTLFHFTSETPEDPAAANRQGFPVFHAARVRTRQEARDIVPDILVTNYSMLEYMLCRPQDAVFFGSALQCFVVDEAHVYGGTLAAEISLLMRRVFLRAEVPPTRVFQMATSATLGEGVKRFAAELFGRSADSIDWIVGEPMRRKLPAAVPPATSIEPSFIQAQQLEDVALVSAQELVEDPSTVRTVLSAIDGLVGRSVLDNLTKDTFPARVLFEGLARSPIVQRLEEVIWTNRTKSLLPVSTVAAELWGLGSEETLRATLELLQLGARARLSAADLPLIPHKLHLMVRSPITASVCLNADCIEAPHRIQYGGAIVADALDRCPWCSSAMLTLCRCGRCGEALFAGLYRMDNSLHLRPRWNLEPPPTGTLYRYATRGNSFHFDLRDRYCEEYDGPTVSLEWIDSCPNCGADSDSFRPLGVGDGPILPLVAETLVASMPPDPTDARHWLPASGRRLLVFSDSRREAARLGPLLTRQHETQMGRALLVRVLLKGCLDSTVESRIRKQIAELERELADGSLTQEEREYIRREVLDKSMQIARGSEALPISKWQDLVSKDDLIGEFFAREFSTTQTAADWNIREWERNREHVKKRSHQILATQFASPAWNQISLETVGLAEVVYPEISSLLPSASLLGQLPKGTDQSVLLQNWGAFLASLCDTMRIDGCVTLGSEERDRNVGSSRVDLQACKLEYSIVSPK